jgi:hypothetical protein
MPRNEPKEFIHVGPFPKLIEAKDLGCLVVQLQGVVYPPDMLTTMRMESERADYIAVKSFQVLEIDRDKFNLGYIVVKVGEHNLRIFLKETDWTYLKEKFYHKIEERKKDMESA